MTAMEDAILDFLRETLKLTVHSVDDDLIDDGRLDSLGIVELLFFIEQRFGVRVDIAALEMQDLRCVSSIVRMTQSQSHQARP
jgi:acyl carrier protein